METLLVGIGVVFAIAMIVAYAKASAARANKQKLFAEARAFVDAVKERKALASVLVQNQRVPCTTRTATRARWQAP